MECRDANYSVSDYVADFKAIAAEESSHASIAERIKPLAEKLTAEKNWFKDEYRQVDEEHGFGLHLLFEETNHDFAVFVIAWAPGRGVAAHNHKT